MPKAAATICKHSGCSILVRANGKQAYCATHAPLHRWVRNDAQRADDKARRTVTGRTLQRERAALAELNPLCAHCELAGRISVGTQRDHIVPLCEGGRDVRANTQLLCNACHLVKSNAEAQRAVARAMGRAPALPADERDDYLVIA